MNRLGLWFIILVAYQANAQVVFELPQEEKRDTNVNGSVSVGISLIDPSSINQYIRDQVPGPSYTLYGSPDIASMAYFAVGIQFPVTTALKSRIMLEYGGSTKTVTINSEQIRYSLNRLSPLVGLDYFFPGKSDEAFSVGGAVHYTAAWFERVKADGFTGTFNLGYTWYRFKCNYNLVLGANLASLSAKANNANITSFDFTGPFLKVIFDF